MSQETGAWLRRERQARGWDCPEMARQLIAAGKARNDYHVPGVKSLCHNIYRWENGDGISQRYVLAYCAAFGIDPDEFPHHPDARRRRGNAPGRTWPAAAAGCGPGTEQEVKLAARDGSEWAGRAEQRGTGEATLDQFRADVARLSRDYMSGEPLPLFREMREVRDLMHGALERRVWPRDTTEIYFLLGCLNGLMGCAAADLGHASSAAQLTRAAWAYAMVIDHGPLMAKLRLDLAGLADGDGRYRCAADYASSGLEYQSRGPTAVQLHLRYGHAAARLGDTASARRAIAMAEEDSGRQRDDELTAIGGEFDLSRASARYLVGAVLMELPGASPEAAARLEEAVSLYAAGPAPGETHGYGIAALASLALAEARLSQGELQEAARVLEQVLALPASRRIDPIPQRLARVRAALGAPAFRATALARDLDERIEAFSR